MFIMVYKYYIKVYCNIIKKRVGGLVSERMKGYIIYFLYEKIR